MTGLGATLALNARWEGRRLWRSRRVWLLLIPAVAGPIGSSLADVYLGVPSVATAEVLGLLVTGGLAALVTLDLTALAVGEDRALRTEYLTLALPQSPAAAVTGRLVVPLGGAIVSYLTGAAILREIAPVLVRAQAGAAPAVLPPGALLVALPAVLVFLGGISAAGAALTRHPAQGIVAAVLGGVVAAGVGAELLVQGTLTIWFPVVLALSGAVGLGWAIERGARPDD